MLFTKINTVMRLILLMICLCFILIYDIKPCQDDMEEYDYSIAIECEVHRERIDFNILKEQFSKPLLAYSNSNMQMYNILLAALNKYSEGIEYSGIIVDILLEEIIEWGDDIMKFVEIILYDDCDSQSVVFYYPLDIFEKHRQIEGGLAFYDE